MSFGEKIYMTARRTRNSIVIYDSHPIRSPASMCIKFDCNGKVRTLHSL